MKTPEETRDRLNMDAFHAFAEANRQWGRWGPDDEIGTLNHVTPQMVAHAATLARTGKSFSLAMDFASSGPQRQKPGGKRYNPILTMLSSGADCCAPHNQPRMIYAADDTITMPLQCATQWDSLAHVFYYEQMWNGYDARLVDGSGAAKCSIEKTRNKMAGRGVLLDIARLHGVDALPPGYGVGVEDIEACEKAQGVTIGTGDFMIVRTGHMEACEGQPFWGDYIGDTPGLTIQTATWLREREVAAVATDTYCVEVRPHQVPELVMPFHWVAIPNIGLTLGEMFRLKELAADCAQDKVYEFLFCAPPLPVLRAVGSPINPMAFK